MIERSWIASVTPELAPAPSVSFTPTDAGLHARVSAAGNGRVPGTIGQARRLAWSSAGTDLARVSDVLAHGDHVVVVRDADRDLLQRVDVLDHQGRVRQTIVGRRGPWVVDARGPKILGSSRTGHPTAWSLADPDASPIMWSTRFGERELRDLRMLDARLVATGLQPRRIDGVPPSVLVATIEIASWDDVSPFRTLRSATGLAECIADSTAHAVLGIEPAGPILATDEHIAWMDWSLELRAELELPGHPIVVTPRSDGRAWMLALRDGEPELRVLSPGACELAIPVHHAFIDAERLLVAPDDAVIVVSPSRIQCFDAHGGFRWKFARDGAARALVDANGSTLFTHGGSVIAADPSGQCQPVWTAPPGTARLGALTLVDDELLVSAGSDVLALARA